MRQIKKFPILRASAIAIGLLLGTSTVQAQTVERDGDTATAIMDLQIGGVTYDVEFIRSAAAVIYDDPPVFDFNTVDDAEVAIEAVNAALNTEGGIDNVGESADTGLAIFRIGYDVEGAGATRLVNVWESTSGDQGTVWMTLPDPSTNPFFEERIFADFTVVDGTPPPAEQAQLATTVQPPARSVQTDDVVNFSASYTNGGTMMLSNCQTSLATDIPASLMSSDLAGEPLEPFSLGPSETRSLILTIEPSAAFPSTQVFFDFVCEEPGGAPVEAPDQPGVNVIVLTASDIPTADVIALAITPSGDGILTADPSNAFALATTNLGVGAEITVAPNTGATGLPLTLSVCETNPMTGACINPTTPTASVTTTIGADETPTFTVFVTSDGMIPLDPTNSRIFVPFIDNEGGIRGNTSVAVTSSVEPEPAEIVPGEWRDAARDVCFNVSTDGTRLTPELSNCPNGASLWVDLSGSFNSSGIPCDITESTTNEIPIVPATADLAAYFSWIGGRNVYVEGDFVDPAQRSIGNAITVTQVRGLCAGVWRDATPQ